MSKETAVTTAEACLGQKPRKTRLALMGEFSAGKSTLSKLFLGDAPLPVKVTATRLPPVWISHGESAAIAVGHDGSRTPIEIDDIHDVRIEDTRLIRLYNPSETLEICDLIDMPGISDPNMSSDVWLSVMDEVDSVVWCTHATQAWRQSEAATWQQIADRTNGDNILLITQIDKLRSERDVERVMMRVRKETEGQFKAVYPLSITGAIAAGEDEAKWNASGAAEFIDHLVDLLMNPSEKPAREPEAGDLTQRLQAMQEEESLRSPAMEETEEPVAAQAPAAPAKVLVAPASPDAVESEFMDQRDMPAPKPPAEYGATSVIPKRVRVLTEMRGRTARPTASDTVII